MSPSSRSQGAFNVLHLETMYKVDVFVMRDRPFDQAARRRTRSLSLADDSSRRFAIASPEDTVLSKLEWYRDGGEQSERQWTDISCSTSGVPARRPRAARELTTRVYPIVCFAGTRLARRLGQHAGGVLR